MRHAADHSKWPGLHAKPAFAIAGLLILAGCSLSLPSPPQPGFLGREIDPGPAPSAVTTTGGLHGDLLSGGQEPLIPAAQADEAVPPPLSRLLQPKARLALAQASQEAAIAERNRRVDWAVPTKGDAPGTGGWVMPVSDPYYSPHGLVCRDLREALARPEGAVIEPVSLCREETASGHLAFWTIEHFP